MDDMIYDTARRFCADHADACFEAMPKQADAGAIDWLPDVWAQAEDLGLPLALLSEEQGGFDLSARAALGVVRILAQHAIPLPLGETMVANWLLVQAGLAVADGPATLAAGPTLSGDRLTGTAPRVAYGRHAGTTVLICGDRIVRAGKAEVAAEGHNLAAEPRDDLHWPGATVETAAAPVSEDAFRALGAVLRAQALAGAMQAAQDMTAAYVSEREQFGRPLAKFQALQQQMAIMAGETAAAAGGADLATALLPQAGAEGDAFVFAAAAAKVRAGEAAGKGAAIAHQLHGAIGFTREYRLHALTRRLWAWRDEWGREAEWSDLLGRRIATLPANGLWPFLTGIGDAA